MKEKGYQRFSDVKGIEYESQYKGDAKTLPGYGAKPGSFGWYHPETYDSSISPARIHRFHRECNSLEERYEQILETLELPGHLQCYLEEIWSYLFTCSGYPFQRCEAWDAFSDLGRTLAVSYTHLTLPTILLV